MRTAPIAAALAVLTLAGCGKPEPPVDDLPQKLADAITQLEAKTVEVFEGFESGDPMAADEPMHEIGKPLVALKELAGKIEIDESTSTAIADARDKLLEAFGELHEPMHHGGFPDDFDFEPIREKLVGGLADLREALPEEVVALLPKSPVPAVPAAGSEASVDEPPTDAPTDAPRSESDEQPESDAAPAADDGAAATGATGSRVARAPVCPSVMLWDEPSLDLAPERVARVARLLADAPPEARWVQLVPTLHARLAPDLSVQSYGMLRSRDGPWRDPENFATADNGLADRLRTALAEAIGQAVRRGLSVAILPHIDSAGGPVEAWRNEFRFDPAATYGGGSYESLLLGPIADAIQRQGRVGLRVDLALSGEMTRSLLEHPTAYRQTLATLRTRFDASPRTSGVRLGVSLNWDAHPGGAAPDAAARAEFAALVDDCDFIGFSCYAPVGVPPKPADFAAATRGFLLGLERLAGRKTAPHRLVISEVGIGGGHPTAGDNAPAYPTPAEVAANPAAGSGRPRFDPWRSAPLSDLRRSYYAALLGYLAAPDPPVERAFLWSEGPWDPQGVADDRYADTQIARAIAEHNRTSVRARARRAARAASETGERQATR
ncbi:hypothetical protein [Botrimarina sp.]|uniref:hypothetical protein n=1 Tax=Botrimarina sp. TaxID=2795802 RepID=UPI0032ECB5D4